MLSFLAAAWAPARILSQKVSPGVSWVIIAMVYRGVLATCPAPAWADAALRARDSDLCTALRPPVELQPASMSATPERAATIAVARRDRLQTIGTTFR